MPLPQLTITEDFSEFGEVGRGFRREAKRNVRDFGRTVIADARPYAKVKTGAYRASMYFRTQNYSTYAGAAEDARRLNPEAHIMAEVPPVEDELEIVFGIAVGYGYAVHEGLGPHTDSPNPVLRESIERHKDEYALAVGLALDRTFQKTVRAARKYYGSRR